MVGGGPEFFYFDVRNFFDPPLCDPKTCMTPLPNGPKTFLTPPPPLCKSIKVTFYEYTELEEMRAEHTPQGIYERSLTLGIFKEDRWSHTTPQRVLTQTANVP